MAVLRVRFGEREIACLPIGREPVLIGRSAGATLRLEDNLVSNEHARVITAENGLLCVRDLGSRNGTFVNGCRLGPRDTPFPIGPGDELVVGRSTIVVAEDGVEPDEATLVLTPNLVLGPPPPAGDGDAATIASLRLNSLDAGWAASRGPGEEDLALLWHEGEAINRLSDRWSILEAVRRLLVRALHPARVFAVERAGDGRLTCSTPAFGAPPSRTVIERAIASDSVVLVKDVPGDAGLARAASARIGGLKFVMAAPVRRRGEAIAALYADRLDERAFTERDLCLLGIVANHASAALENAAHVAGLLAACNELAALNGDLEREVEARAAAMRLQAERIVRLVNEQDELLRMAARDIREPLAGALGLLETAGSDCAALEGGAPVGRSLAFVADAIHRVLALASDHFETRRAALPARGAPS